MTLLWRGRKDNLEVAVPRVGGKRTGKGLADSRSGVGDNLRGTPKLWARARLASERQTVRSTVLAVKEQRPREARTKEAGQEMGKESWGTKGCREDGRAVLAKSK